MNNVYLKLQSTTHVVQFEREDWAEIRNCEEESGKNDDLYTISQPNILKINDDNELNYWLAKFVVEVRKKKPCGEPYPPNTLYHALFCSIQRHFRENDGSDRREERAVLYSGCESEQESVCNRLQQVQDFSIIPSILIEFVYELCVDL